MLIRLTTAILAFALLVSAALATQETTTVKFQPGTDSATLSGSITDAGVKQRGEQHDRYILGARAGQVMAVDVSSDGPVRVYVWKDDFNQGFLCDTRGESGAYVRFKLPSTGNYQVDIDRVVEGTPDHRPDLNYKVKFTITH